MGNAKRRHPPALTPEDRENQLIAASMDLAEKQIREGTASAQVVTHFLRLGSSKYRLENEKLKTENRLLEAKIEAYESQQDIKQLYQEAIDAMRRYSGREDYEDYEVYDD